MNQPTTPTFKSRDRFNSGLTQFSVACALIVLTGCAQLPPPEKASSADLLNLSRPLEQAQEFRLAAEPRMRPVEIVIANSSDASGGYGAGGNYAEIARTDLNEIFANCENYIVANRSVNRQASAELKLRESTSQQPAASPVAPQFIIKATVMQVEREIKSDGTKTAWNYLITAESAKAQRQGAVEVLVEIVGLDKLTTLFATRSYALLYDTTKESSVGLAVVSTAHKSTTRVPERQAIRSACQDAATKVHKYFASRH